MALKKCVTRQSLLRDLKNSFSKPKPALKGLQGRMCSQVDKQKTVDKERDGSRRQEEVYEEILDAKCVLIATAKWQT